MLRDGGSLDAGDLVIELERLLGERADVRARGRPSASRS